MKLKDLVKATRVFETLGQEKISVSLAYKFMKIIKETKNDIDFYQTKGQEIVNKYALRDENGNIRQNSEGLFVDPEKADDFNKEFEELNNTDVNIPDIKFALEELQEFKITTADLLSIEDFLNK